MVEDIASIILFLLRSSTQGTLQLQGLCKDAYEWKSTVWWIVLIRHNHTGNGQYSWNPPEYEHGWGGTWRFHILLYWFTIGKLIRDIFSSTTWLLSMGIKVVTTLCCPSPQCLTIFNWWQMSSTITSSQHFKQIFSVYIHSWSWSKLWQRWCHSLLYIKLCVTV